MHIAGGLVDQQQVDISQVQPVQGSVYGAQGVRVKLMYSASKGNYGGWSAKSEPNMKAGLRWPAVRTVFSSVSNRRPGKRYPLRFRS